MAAEVGLCAHAHASQSGAGESAQAQHQHAWTPPTEDADTLAHLQHFALVSVHPDHDILHVTMVVPKPDRRPRRTERWYAECGPIVCVQKDVFEVHHTPNAGPQEGDNA